MFSSCFSLFPHLNSAVEVHSLQHCIFDLFVPGHSTCMSVALTHVWLRPWTPPNALTEAHLSLPNQLCIWTAAQQHSCWLCCAFFSSMTVPWLVSNLWCSCFSLLLPWLTLACLLALYWGPWLGISAIFFFIMRCLLFLLSLCSLCSFYALCSVSYSHSTALFHVPNGGSSLFRNVS